MGSGKAGLELVVFGDQKLYFFLGEFFLCLFQVLDFFLALVSLFVPVFVLFYFFFQGRVCDFFDLKAAVPDL